MIPDAEKVASDYLREHADVAEIVGRRVVGKTPSEKTEPWVRVTELAAPQQPNSKADHLVGFVLQLDCYAGADGGQPEAKLLARTVRAALHAMPGVHGDTVVTATRNIGWRRVPDSDGFEPARERVIITTQAWMHA